MLCRLPVSCILLVMLAIAGPWTASVLAAEGEPPARAAQKEAKPDLAEALRGLKGFLVGELVETRDDGVTLLIRSVTLVEGSQAANPGVLLGRETQVAYATEDDEGEPRPMPALVKAVAHIREMPAIAFGGLGGNAVVVMDAPRGGAAALGHHIRVATQRMTMRVNGAEIRIGGDEDDGEEPAREPKGPLMTARVLAGEDGKLVMDRVMPGSTPAHTWAGMPRLRIAEEPEEAAAEAGPVEVDVAPAEVAVELVERAEDAHARAAEQRERMARARAEAAELVARQKALKAQIKALSKHLAVLKKHLAREGLPEQQADHLRRQQAEVRQRIAQLEAEAADTIARARNQEAVAEALQREAAARKARQRDQEPERPPQGTDF